MISLRRWAIALQTVAAAALFSACATSDLTLPVHSGASATTDRRDDDRDHRPPAPCLATARVVVDKLGNATLEVRSGTFDNVTNTGTPYGLIRNVEYTIKSPAGKVLLDKEEKVKPANALFTRSITVLQPAVTTGKDSDDGKSKSKIIKPAVLFDPVDVVSVEVTVERPRTASPGHDGHHDRDHDDDDEAVTCTVVIRAPVVQLKPSGQTIDVFVDSIELDLGNNQRVALGQIAAGVSANYIATIRATPLVGNNTSAPVTCSVTVFKGTTVVTTVTGTVTGAASTTSAALCRFSLTLAGNGDLDENYRIQVTTGPITADDIATGNNTLSATQTAIVRVDVSITQIRLVVDTKVLAALSPIPKGKTGHYTVTFTNPSSRAAKINCTVTAGPAGTVAVPVSLVGTVNPITIPANGGTATCKFDYVFSQLVAVNFAVSTGSMLPLDSDPSNNAQEFQTVVESDHTFPAIDRSNVHALQKWVTDPTTHAVTILSEQGTSISRITLAFAATAETLGDFKLTGIVTTGSTPTESRPISKATLTALALPRARNGFPSCVSGVDAGATAVNQHQLNLSICAQEVPGDATVQAIYVEYESSVQTPIASPLAATLFGSSITFDVSLEWTLFGSTFKDNAGALLQFQLQEVSPGPDLPNNHEKTQTGVVIVKRNGAT